MRQQNNQSQYRGLACRAILAATHIPAKLCVGMKRDRQGAGASHRRFDIVSKARTQQKNGRRRDLSLLCVMKRLSYKKDQRTMATTKAITLLNNVADSE
jgi:hypothetical protein